jgi:hypothetical protein
MHIVAASKPMKLIKTKNTSCHRASAAVGAMATLALLSGVCCASTPWHTPPKGSAERAQIMDALRAKLSTFDPANKDLIFVVKELCVSPTAGWLSAEPQSRDGKNRLEAVQVSLKRSQSGWSVDTVACTEEDCAKGTDAKALRARANPQCD